MQHDLTEAAGAARGAAPASSLVNLAVHLARLHAAMDDFEMSWRRFLTSPLDASWDNGTRNGDDVQYAADHDEWSRRDDAA